MGAGNKRVSVIYFGGNRAGVENLRQLLSWNVEIKLVVVRASDKGLDTWAPSLKKFALEKKLNIFQPDDPNSRDSVNFYKSFAFDYLISVQYDKILKNSVLSLAGKGAVNLHFAPLPKYRGCWPISWAIIEGGNAGVTLHWMDKGIDTGDIICAGTIPTFPDKTARQVYESATDRGREIFQEMMPKILSGEIIRYPQDNSIASYYPKGEPYNRTINWSWTVDFIGRFIRAFTFPPYASARTFFGHYEIEIMYPLYKTEKSLAKQNAGSVLNINDSLSLEVQCGDGVLSIPHYRLKLDDRYVEDLAQVMQLSGLKKGCMLRQGK